jgi:hypothetical protein
MEGIPVIKNSFRGNNESKGSQTCCLYGAKDGQKKEAIFMEQNKNRTWVRILGFVILVAISLMEAVSSVWTRMRRKWAEL